MSRTNVAARGRGERAARAGARARRSPAMSKEKQSPSETVSSFWNAFEAGRMDELIRDHVAEKCEFIMPGSPPLSGAAAIRRLFEAYRAAFPDFKHRTLHAIESGDTYAAET